MEKKKMRMFTFYLGDGLREEIKEVAEMLHKTQSETMRMALRIGLATIKGSAKK